MKNKIILMPVLSILLLIVLGCSFSENLEKTIGGGSEANSNNATNKTLSDRAIETAVGDEKIGVAECDNLLERLAEVAQKPDDNYVSKATRQFVLSKIRENVRRSIEENKNDKTQLAKDCKDFHSQLNNIQNQEEANKQADK